MMNRTQIDDMKRLGNEKGVVMSCVRLATRHIAQPKQEEQGTYDRKEENGV